MKKKLSRRKSLKKKKTSIIEEEEKVGASEAHEDLTMHMVEESVENDNSLNILILRNHSRVDETLNNT
jgi:hypothetical protein